ncbi:MAG: type III pantothenate kinase [Gammaproteobacteria bacterium]
MILLLDVGNSRIKAASLENGQISPIGSVEHRGVGLGPAVVAAERLPNNVDRIVASCVAGPITQGELGAALADRFGVQAEFVTAAEEACGVTNAYVKPHRLGADRWAALVGAHARGHRITCVIDAGTALTVDGLINGHHLGGLILPGLDLMRGALLEETGELRALSEDPLSGGMELFANDTHEAIVRGSMVAAISVIQRCRKSMAHRAGQSPEMMLTGGDAQRLLALFDEPVIYAPHLTLEGLAILAEQSAVEEEEAAG